MITSQKTLINIKNDYPLAHSKDHSTVPQHQGVQQYLQDKAKFRRYTCLPNFLKAEQIKPFRKGRFIDPPTATKSRIQEAWS
jgi:hypothetical protein